MGKQARRARAIAKASAFDFTGIPDQRVKVAPTDTAGVAGTAVYGGYVETNEKKPELVGQNKWKTFSDILLNVSIVASGVRYYLNLVSKPAWRAEPAEKSGKQGEQIAIFVQECMDKLETPWNRVVKRAALYRTHGYSIQEWTAKVTPEGRLGMLDIESRPQKTIHQWDTTQTGKILGVSQLSPFDGQLRYLPREKFIYVVDDSISDDPEGNGLLRHLAEPTRILHRYQQLEGWGFETDLRGIPVGRAPFTELNKAVATGAMTQAQADAIVEPMHNFVKRHIKNPELGLLIDSIVYESSDDASTPSTSKLWDIDLMKAGATGQQEVAVAIERLMRDIARVLGVEHLLMGDNGVGSFAMAKDKSHNFALMIDAALRDIAQAFMKDWVTQIMLLNGWDLKLMPKLVTDKLQYRSVEQLTASLADMAKAGAVLGPDDPAIGQIYDLMGLTRPPGSSPFRDASLLQEAAIDTSQPA